MKYLLGFIVILFAYLLVYVDVTNAASNTSELSNGNPNKTLKQGVIITQNVSSTSNNSFISNYDGITTYFSANSGMLRRGFYVLVALTAIIILYFVFRMYRTNKKKTKKYGRLSSTGDNLELNHLNSDSDDDYTVYETKAIH